MNVRDGIGVVGRLYCVNWLAVSVEWFWLVCLNCICC